jgi:integrase/recombinase XerD
MPHARRGLALDQLPEGDQAHWHAARTKAAPLDEPGGAADWRPKVVRTVTSRYAMWLACLRDDGHLDASAPPAARLTREYLLEFVEDLRARGLSPVTIAGYVRDVREAVRVMQPGADLSVINHLLCRLDAVAEPVRDKAVRVVSPALLLEAAIAEIIRLHDLLQRKPSRRTAGRFRDALLVGILATRPLRLANLTAIELVRHLFKKGTVYCCRFTGPETKEDVPLDFPMPETLTVWLDRYIEFHRPLLLRGRDSNRLWISTRSAPMVDNTIHCRVVHTTEQLMGRPINPHLFRDCVATFIAEQMPEEVKIIARILGHATLATAEDYYNHASMLSAQARYLEALARLRRGDNREYPQQPSP